MLRVWPRRGLPGCLFDRGPDLFGGAPVFFSIVTAGKRACTWRGRAVDTRIKPAATGAIFSVGILAWGGGIRFTIGPLPDDIWARELRAPAKEKLWRPEPGKCWAGRSRRRRWPNRRFAERHEGFAEGGQAAGGPIQADPILISIPP